MKKHTIRVHTHNSILHVAYHHTTYAIPLKIANKYIVECKHNKVKRINKTLKNLMDNLDKIHTQTGALLKGLRLREGLTQTQFAKKIKVSQANLSSMENGKRPIGKIIAKRIEKIFGTNYRYFLE